MILVMSTVLRKTVEDTGAEKEHCSQEDYFSFLFLFFCSTHTFFKTGFIELYIFSLQYFERQNPFRKCT